MKPWTKSSSVSKTSTTSGYRGFFRLDFQIIDEVEKHLLDLLHERERSFFRQLIGVFLVPLLYFLSP